MPDIKHFDPDAALERAEHCFWQHGAEASVQQLSTATGLNRSSLYATFGGKHRLYLAALRRYVHEQSQPALRALATDPRGLPAVREFFTGLIALRSEGPYAGWGCFLVNAHREATADAEVRAVLEEHHHELVTALRAALKVAGRRGQLPAHLDPDAAAETLALLAYGVNVRSRAGAPPESLRASVQLALGALASA